VRVKRRWVLWGLLLAAGLGLLRWWQWVRLESSQDTVILAAAERYGVEPALIKAVVWRESRFDPLARGRKGEIGLMQIMKDTANDWATSEKMLLFQHERLFDPALNTEAGAWYLRKLLRRYANADNPLPYALADYNAGRGNVLRWARGPAATNSQEFIEQISYPGTRDYVRAVLKRYEKYRGTFPAKTLPRAVSLPPEPCEAPPGFGVRQPSGAFGTTCRDARCDQEPGIGRWESGRGLPHSTTLARARMPSQVRGPDARPELEVEPPHALPQERRPVL
jgi:soluble lytic murein transglycosylase